MKKFRSIPILMFAMAVAATVFQIMIDTTPAKGAIAFFIIWLPPIFVARYYPYDDGKRDLWFAAGFIGHLTAFALDVRIYPGHVAPIAWALGYIFMLVLNLILRLAGYDINARRRD